MTQFCPLTGRACDCPVMCQMPAEMVRSQLGAFNDERRRLLQGRPINPEGERALGPLLDDA